MFGDDMGGESFEERLRALAAEVRGYIERSIDNVDVDEFADSLGVNPAIAREWVETAGGWLSAYADTVGDHIARQAAGTGPSPGGTGSGKTVARVDPLGGVGPNPLDLPSDEQGVALAVLDSGRWIIEPGADTLAARGEGPGPSDALGIVRELRVRDWIAGDGKLTMTGRRALSRWLDAAAST
jgi:hypothetical protein